MSDDKQEALAGEGVEAWVLVPRKPTEAMIYEGEQAINGACIVDSPELSEHAYAAMIAAAPEPSRTLPSNEALAGDDRNGVEEYDALAADLERKAQEADGNTFTFPIMPCEAERIVAALRARTPSSPQADEADVERLRHLSEIRHLVDAIEGESIPHCRRRYIVRIREALAAIATMTTRPAGGEEVDDDGEDHNPDGFQHASLEVERVIGDAARHHLAALTKPAALPKEGEGAIRAHAFEEAATRAQDIAVAEGVAWLGERIANRIRALAPPSQAQEPRS